MNLAKATWVEQMPYDSDHSMTFPDALRPPVILPYGATLRDVHRVARSNRRCRGVTLLEVMIALVVLSISFLGSSAMILGTIRSLSHSQNLTKATTLAREQSERIVRADYDTVVAANYPPDNYTTMAGYEQFQRTVTITNDTPKANAKTITVRVSWRNNARITKTAVLSTVIIQ